VPLPVEFSPNVSVPVTVLVLPTPELWFIVPALLTPTFSVVLD
jgi:hypothetical protein